MRSYHEKAHWTTTTRRKAKTKRHPRTITTCRPYWYISRKHYSRLEAKLVGGGRRRTLPVLEIILIAARKPLEREGVGRKSFLLGKRNFFVPPEFPYRTASQTSTEDLRADFPQLFFLPNRAHTQTMQQKSAEFKVALNILPPAFRHCPEIEEQRDESQGKRSG